MNSFKKLGIRKTSDVRAIKRAYAALLKSTRPDQDPDAFQALNEAYQDCLNYAQYAKTYDQHTEIEDEASLFISNPPHSEQASIENIELNEQQFIEPEVHFDSHQFFLELDEKLKNNSPGKLLTWLNEHPALFSLQRKANLRYAVVNWLEQLSYVPQHNCIKAITTFFALNTLNGRDDLSQHMEYVQQQLDEQDSFENLFNNKLKRYGTWTDRLMVTELSSPFSIVRRLFFVLFPGLPTRLRNLWQELHQTSPRLTVQRLNADTVHFWINATDRTTLSQQRWSIAFARSALFVLALNYFSVFDTPGNDLIFRSPINFLVTIMTAWSLYAFVQAAIHKLSTVLKQRYRFDSLTLNTTVAVVLGMLAMIFTPLMGAFWLPIVGLYWLSARNGERSNIFASALSGLIMFSLCTYVLNRFFGFDMLLRYKFCIAAGYTFAVLMLHDVYLAKHQEISIASAHLRTGYLWYVFAIHVLIFVLLSYI